MSQHIGPRTISAQGGSIKRVGNYRIHTFPSELVADGLVLNLDAGDPRSYPSSGATWTDLSGNGNNGTLVNGPTYSNADGGGALIFDGSTEFVSFSSAPDTVNTGYTIGAWFRATSFGTNAQGLVSYGNETTSQRRALFLWDGGSSGIVRLTSSTYGSNILGSTTLALNTWYYGVVTVLSTGECKIYLNGVLDGSGTNTLVSPTSNTLYVGKTGSSEYFNGKISFTHIYNRALSAAEVAQNYDALRVRYGAYTNTFTPICGGGEGKVEVLCVAGGGGGGGYHAGGGGAGGLLYNSAFSVDSNSSVSVTVGGGGISGTGTAGTGDAGGNSVFGSLTSYGGGAGISQSITPVAKNSGGSGGGGCDGTAASLIGGSGVSGQGFKGGNSLNTNGNVLAVFYGTAGGGGAGGEGGPGGAVNGGYGGPGLSYSISGTSTYYAGGGGGTNLGQVSSYGFGGIGGGGDGGASNSGGNTASKYSLNGIPNTGGGGAGHLFQNHGGGNGANGTVIVRYPATDYNVEVLVVGGGGGGGYCKVSDGGGGGGGAGGLIYNSSYAVSSGKKLRVNIGRGGDASVLTDGTENSENGQNSIFNTLIAIGGGGGGSTRDSSVLNVGGSGGGAGSDVGNDNGGFGTAGQGNNGGNNTTGNTGAGGGGAGAVGISVADGTETPNGGVGLAYSITGTSTYYAGGGGGGKYNNGSGNAGTGGLGGGGNGGKGAAGSNGTANTGGGGGGGGMVSGVIGHPGGNGGSGIVIIAYKGPQRGIGGTIDTTSRPGYTLHKFTTTGTDFFIP